MHKNISEKIKRLAEGIMYLGAFISLVFGVLAAIRYSGEAGRIICLLIVSAGCVISYVMSILTYGFGELIEKTVDTSDNTKEMLVLLNRFKNDSEPDMHFEEIKVVTVDGKNTAE